MGQQDRELKDAASLEAWLIDEICRLNAEMDNRRRHPLAGLMIFVLKHEVDKKRDMLARVIERKQELIDADTQK